MGAERLFYLPLGGAGEIGMNCYVYGYGKKNKERLIVVDMGVAFPDMDSSPGVDLIFPDISWLKARKERIEGIFITHAHEDHIGAVGHFFAQLGAPIYARRFTAAIAQRKLDEHNVQSEKAVHVTAAWPKTVSAGPFKIGFMPVSHSVPESAALVIDTPAGRLVHTGDFKLDPTPLVGEPWDEALWADVAKDGIKALICDSTNVFSPHAGRSEHSLQKAIQGLVAQADNMVVATTFASNVARVKTLALAGVAAGRSVCLAGRAMIRMVETAVKTGVLKDFPPVLPIEEAISIPRQNLMLLVTGSQGERRAATAQLSNGKYRGLELKKGDLFLFSSKTIPGNERAVIRIINNLSEMGVDVVDDSMQDYHVSGHANRPDLAYVHALMKPQMLIPMHGEHRHLREHANLAQQNGIASIVAVNGTMIDLSENKPKVAAHIETARVYLDGKLHIGALEGVVRERIKMALNGQLVVNVILEENEVVGDVWVETLGLAQIGASGNVAVEQLEKRLSALLDKMRHKMIADDTLLEKELCRLARNAALQEWGKKPQIKVLISRLEAE